MLFEEERRKRCFQQRIIEIIIKTMGERDWGKREGKINQKKGNQEEEKNKEKPHL